MTEQVTEAGWPATADRLICPVCGTANAPDASFCGNCGRAFVVVAPPASSGRRPWLLLLPVLLLVCATTAGLLLAQGDGLPAAVAGLFADPTAIASPRRPTPVPEQTAPSEAVDTPLPSPTTEPTLTPVPLPTATDIILPTLTPLPTPMPPTTIPVPDEIVFQSNRDGDFDIYIMNIDGSNQRQLTFNTIDDRFPRVSPDGRHIVYQSGRGTNAEIYIMNRDGSTQQRLTFNEQLDDLPAWSPDGRQIIFITWISQTDSELFVMNADGSSLSRITDTSTDEGHVSWSAVGLVFNATEAGTSNYQLYRSDAAGGNRQRLTISRVDEWSPEWSPDGREILFLSERGSSVNSGIYVMDAATGETRPIYNNEDSRLMEWGAVWSADGQQIVFAMDQADGSADIYIMNADGSDIRRLSERGGYPAWAPGSS